LIHEGCLKGNLRRISSKYQDFRGGAPTTHATAFTSASVVDRLVLVIAVCSSQSERPQRQHFHSRRVVVRQLNRCASEM